MFKLAITLIIVIMTIGLTTFHYGKKTFEGHVDEKEFKTWRQAWIVITFLAFFSGNFFVFMGAASLAAYYFGRRVDNKIALFLVIFFAFPPYQVITPIIYLSYWRALSLVLLLPMFFSTKWRKNTPRLGKPLGDKLVIAMLILMFFLNLRGTTTGDSIRTSITFFIDWLVPYFAISRCIKDFEQLKTALIALTLACTMSALVSVFEFVNAWLLYQDLPSLLNFQSVEGGYLGRDGLLRALASMGHPLNLGLVLLVTIGINLSLSSIVESKRYQRGYFLSLLLGLYATLSRGPWAATGIAITLYIATGKKAVSRTIMLIIGFILAVMILPSIPGGQKIINMLPFIGQSEQFNVEYRQQLIPKSILILKRSPLFGVFDAREEPEMEDMKQGEGIVDIVNSYLNIALSYGLVGLTIFLWIFIWGLFRVLKVMKYIKDKTSLRYKLGHSFSVTYIGIMLMLSSISFVSVVGPFVFIFLGLSASYARIIYNEASAGVLNKPEENTSLTRA